MLVRKFNQLLIICLLMAILVIWATSGTKAQDTSLTQAYQILKNKQTVDLTHAFEPGIPHWLGFPDETRKTLYWYEPVEGVSGSGFFAQQYCLVGQWGTHVDPPAPKC